MNLNPLATLDPQASARQHEATPAAEAREAESASLAVLSPAPDNSEPSRSERLYEAYRLWAFTGR